MPRESRSKRSIVVVWGVPTIIAFVLLSAVLYGPVHEARERARRSLHVSTIGQGSAQHFTKLILASGEPASEVDRLVSKEVDEFVDVTLPEEIKIVEWARSEGRPQSRALGLYIFVPQLSGRSLGRLHEFTRTDGIYLGLLIETSRVTDDGLQGLKSFANVQSITIRGTQISAADVAGLKEALPDCAIGIEK